MVKSPYTCEPDQSIREAYEFMRECGIRHLPVIENDRLVGLVSERDLKPALAYPQASTLQVRNVMKEDVYIASRDSSLRDVVLNMMENRIGSTVIVNSQMNVIGIFTATDALGILADLLEEDEAEDLFVGDYIDSWDVEDFV
jgi:acetoin utilization protein AcuB